MSKVFFKIGTTDFTSAVDIQNFAVNSYPVFEAWTDINGIEHRTYKRTRLQGRFMLGYASETAYAAALATIRGAANAEGYAEVQVWSNNDGATQTADCFLHLVGAAKWDLAAERQWQTLEVEIYER